MEVSFAILSSDEAVRTALETHLGGVAGLKHLQSFGKPSAALYGEASADLLLLDVDGLTLSTEDLEGLAEQYKRWIVLSSKLEQAAFAYDWAAVDFVGKPISVERLLKAVKRAIGALGAKQAARTSVGLLPLDVGVRKDYFFVKSDYKVVKITVDEIQYIEGLREYVRIHTDQGRIVTLATLSRLEEILPVEHFARVHRSFIVNLQKIHFVQGNVISIGNKQVAISKSRREEFLDLLNRDGLF